MSFSVALAVVAFRDAGAAGVGLVALARMLPSAVLTPFVTAVADRARRERVLIVVTVLRAVTIGAAGIVLALGGPLALVNVFAVIATVAFTVFRPAHSALLPSLCATTSDLTSASVVRGLLEALATLVGPAIAGVLLAVGGPWPVFAVAALMSAGAAVALGGIRTDTSIPGPTARRSLVKDTVEGLRAVTSDRDLALIFGAGFAQTYVRGALNVFIVVVAFDMLDTGDSGVAALTAAMGVGGVVGSLGGSFLVGSRRLGLYLVTALVLWGAPIVLIAATNARSAVVALVATIGLANAIIDIPLFTLPVRLAHDAVLARVFGVFEALVAAESPSVRP